MIKDPNQELKELRQMIGKLLREQQAQAAQIEQLNTSQPFGRLGRLRYPDRQSRPSDKILLMRPAGDEETTSDNNGENLEARFKFPANRYTFWWATDFALYKKGEDPNIGLRNTFVSISGESVGLYPHTTPAGEITWRYPGRDFQWGIYDNYGENGFQGQDNLRPSSDCRRSPYGYVFPEEVEISFDDEIHVKASLLGTTNPFDGSVSQNYDLYAILRCYEMVSRADLENRRKKK